MSRQRHVAICLGGCLAMALGVLPAIHAQQSYPMLMSIEPVAAQIGQTSEHTIKSRYTMEGAYRLLVSGDGVSGEVMLPDEDAEPPKSPLQALPVRFTIADDALPGVRDVRVVTPQGVSTVGQLVIVRDPVVSDISEDTPASATPLSIPATLCGGLEKAEDIDYFQFSAQRGQTVSFLVRCMTLQDRIHDLQKHADPIIALRSPDGTTLAVADNVFGADPLLSYTFEQDGEYLLELRDVRYQGNAYWQYAIEVSQRPYVRAVFPPVLAPEQESREVQAILPSVITSHFEPPSGRLRLPAQAGAGVHSARLSLADHGDQSVPVLVDPGPLTIESSQDHRTPESAQPMEMPSGVSGKISSPGEIDHYSFQATKGEVYKFEVFAQRVGSALDSYLRLLDTDGRQLQVNDDLRDGKRNYRDSRIEAWTAPADGRYVLELRDLNLRGGDDFHYFLKAAPLQPHFRLFADTDKTLLTPGISGVIFVRAERVHGFDGEIRLQAANVPPGVKVTAGRILPGHSDGCIILTAEQDAQPDVANVRISGVAVADDPTAGGDDLAAEAVPVEATIYQEIYQPGGGRGHWPVDDHAVSIGTPGDLLAVDVSPQQVQLRPGESITLDVEIQRAEGFDKNVLLEVTYKHLNSVYGDPLPKGVTVDAAASTTLLTGGATRGTITLQAADDAVAVERQPVTVMANVSINFVMKATYASEPLWLSVQPD